MISSTTRLVGWLLVIVGLALVITGGTMFALYRPVSEYAAAHSAQRSRQSRGGLFAGPESGLAAMEARDRARMHNQHVARKRETALFIAIPGLVLCIGGGILLAGQRRSAGSRSRRRRGNKWSRIEDELDEDEDAPASP